MMQFHLFEVPVPKPFPQQADDEKSRRIAEAGIVLLKNDGGLLPLNAEKLKSMALIGPYAGKAINGGGGSSHVVPLYTVDPLDGLRQRSGSSVNVTLSDGADAAEAA